MYTQQQRRLVTPLLLFVLLALALFATTGIVRAQFDPLSPPQGEPGLLVLTKTVTAGPQPLRPGDRLTYTVRIEHQGGDVMAMTVVTDVLPAGMALAGRPQVFEEVATAGPLMVAVTPQGILWRGRLAPGARIAIMLPARIEYCTGEPHTVVNTATARQTDGGELTASAEFAVECPALPPLSVVKRIVELRGENEVELETADVIPGMDMTFRFKLVNGGATMAALRLQDRLPAGMAPIDEQGRRIMAGVPLTVPAGAAINYDFQARLMTDPIPDHELVNQGRYQECLAADRGRPVCPGLKHGDPAFQPTNPVTLTVRGRDLGDAPDSTNHFAAPMTAYSGVPAHFPTVYEPAIGAFGPMHLAPRPLRLGHGVSREANADVGADDDITNNLLPLVDQANLDRFDDGVRPGPLPLADCKTTVIPVSIFVEPGALALLGDGQGYLNLWIDGNRDGDWADVRDCAEPQGALAFEHVVIDYPLAAASLVTGVNHISVTTTRLAPWPTELAQQPTWIRVTLSERPANKVLTAGSVVYGDGRGYLEPFALGETEDYLWRAAQDPTGGPDLVIHKQGNVLPGRPVTPTVASGGQPPARDLVVWSIEYANRGGATAENVQIVDDLAAAGELTELLIQTHPPLSYTLNGTQLVFAIGRLDAGRVGHILLKTGVPADLTDGTFTNRASITATVDANPANNDATATTGVGLRAPRIVGPGDGTTCENGVTVFGRTAPGSEVDLYVDGVLAGTAAAGEQGRWELALTLADGDHVLAAVARRNGHTSPPSASMEIAVNSALSWSPLSLRFMDSHGRSIRPVDEDGRTDATDWRIRLHPNETYTVAVKLCCAVTGATVELIISDTLTVTLTDADGDQVYAGVFNSNHAIHTGGSLVLVVRCGEEVVRESGAVLIDPEGVVADIKTLAPLNGASVACQQGQNTAAGAGTAVVFDLWDAADYGQINPQTTGGDGYFSFFTPAGVYQLEVTRSGYQPYRSTDIAVVDSAVRYDMALTPAVAEAATHIVAVSETGFEPAFLQVQVGDVVEWVNMGAAGHTATADAALTAAAVGTHFDSGQLLAGESYRFRFDQTGMYTYADGVDLANTGSIQVIEQAAVLSLRLFLPVVAR